MKQTEKILQFMQENGKITQKDAVKFGCYRLSARIHDLKEMGYKIVKENKGFRNEYGCGHYAEYRLAE